MSNEDAYDAFRCIRWVETKGEPVCPHCECAEAYTYKARKIFKCKGCKKQFSVTSGTIFADRKLPIRDYLLAIAIFANGAKGYSMLQLSRDLGVSYKAAFVLTHKLREAMAAEQQDGEALSGHVEVDGGYFGGHIRPANHKKNRIDRRRARYQTGKRRVVVVMRERNGRTLPHVYRSEAAAVPHIAKHVERDATVYADEAVHWDALHARFLTKRINHQQSYSTGDASTNQAESYFSRLRRAEIGTHHHISGEVPAPPMPLKWRGAKIGADTATANSSSPSPEPLLSTRPATSGRAIGAREHETRPHCHFRAHHIRPANQAR